MHAELEPTRRTRLAAVLAGTVLLTLAGAGASAQADDAGPQLSIAVDDGSTTARSGDALRYTVTVTNLGARKVKDLRVTQTVPTGATFLSAEDGGDEAEGTISWSVDLDAAEQVTTGSAMTVGTTPGSALRLATVACAQLSTKGPPLVCASDSDQLPAGAAAERAAAEAVPAADASDGPVPWFAAGGATAVLVALAAGVTVRRRHGAGVRSATGAGSARRAGPRP